MPKSTFSGKIEGFEDCFKALQSLPSITSQKNVLRRALRPAADIYANKAKELAPELEGHLKASIHVVDRPKLSKGAARTKRKSGDKSVEMHVMIDDEAAVPNEYGTSKMAAQPFAIPAYDASKQQMVDAVVESSKKEIGGAIERQARKAARRGS